MGRPRSNELARSGHTPLGEHSRATTAGAPHPQDSGPSGPVPEQNRPGHRPATDQDKPVEAFADHFPVPDDDAVPGREPATVAARLRLGSGFTADEHADVTDRLSSLDNALAAFSAAGVELELSMKDRDRPGQATTLQCWVAGWPRLVATSSQPGVIGALAEARDDLRRQLDDTKARHDPARGHDQRHCDIDR